MRVSESKMHPRILSETSPVVLEKNISNSINVFSHFFLLSILRPVGPVVLEKKIPKFRQFLFTIPLLYPMYKVAALYLNKRKDSLCQVWLKLIELTVDR